MLNIRANKNNNHKTKQTIKSSLRSRQFRTLEMNSGLFISNIPQNHEIARLTVQPLFKVMLQKNIFPFRDVNMLSL